MSKKRFVGVTSFLFLLLAVLWQLTPTTSHAQSCYQADNMAALGRPSPSAVRLNTSALPTTAVESTTTGATLYIVKSGDTLSKIAAAHSVSLYAILGSNNIANPNLIYPGQQLYIPGAVTTTAAAPSQLLVEVWSDGAVVQGNTVTLWAKVPTGSTVRATRGNQTIFFHERCGLQWGLMAFDALRDAAGVHTVRFTVTTAAGGQSVSNVPITLAAGSFWEGPPVRFPPDKQALLEREVIDGENSYLAQRFEASTNPRSAPMWSGLFWRPIDSIVTGPFGSRGVVNGEYTGYHEGLDLRGYTGTSVYASAAGRVVLAETLRVRGGTIFIDHGAGVISGYFHLSGFAVEVGDYVEKAELIGYAGGTGLTTAPHLHWEVRVNNRWVNPVEWLERYYP